MSENFDDEQKTFPSSLVIASPECESLLQQVREKRVFGIFDAEKQNSVLLALHDEDALSTHEVALIRTAIQEVTRTTNPDEASRDAA